MPRLLKISKGFTILELLVVVALIGLFVSIVIASLSDSRTKAQRASVLTSVSGIMPDLVICGDDNGTAPISAPEAETSICTETGEDPFDALLGYETIVWPDISSTGYSYDAVRGTLADGDYEFDMVSSGDGEPITCFQNTASCN